MLPPFACCAAGGDARQAWRHHQERKLRMLRYWRDGLERQMAAAEAAITTLERQMARDSDLSA
ncbi:MAG: sigma factor SigF [Cyanobacteriota bacterium]|nr:sigma factor SigF [Cyanobacteriota bacterium]